MDDLYYNLSEEEFTKGRKVLLWSFSGLFFLAGTYVLFASLVQGHKSIAPVLSVAPFGISLIVCVIACIASFKGTDLFFSIDHEKIEYKFGMFKPMVHSFRWSEVKELVMPHRQRKVKLLFNDGSQYIINLTWIQKKKSIHIRKHIYHVAREKNLTVQKVIVLTS